MDDREQADIVDVFYAPFVRPLGNLVIKFAQAEAALLDLLAALNGGDERVAHEILKSHCAKKQILALVHKLGLEGFDLEEFLQGIEDYWSDKEHRNRYMHDEWYVGPYKEVVPSTRGLPRKKGSEVVWDEPTPSDIWKLAARFREHEGLFAYRAYAFQKANCPPD